MELTGTDHVKAASLVIVGTEGILAITGIGMTDQHYVRLTLIGALLILKFAYKLQTVTDSLRLFQQQKFLTYVTVNEIMRRRSECMKVSGSYLCILGYIAYPQRVSSFLWPDDYGT